jgi:hypothetical protein
MISVPMVHSAQTVHLSCVKIRTISKKTKSSFHLSLVNMECHQVCPKQFLSLWYLSRKLCTYLASGLALIQMDRIELLLEPHHLQVPSGASKMIFEPMVCSAQLVHLSCVKISISPNRPNRASTWAFLRRSTIGCVLNDFWAYDTFAACRAPILHRY